jgi:multidrug efflux pump subunit AcrA (membrane-fusion protein)
MAPIDGVVLSVGADVGERVGTEALVALADLAQPTLEIFLDESDLGRVGLDYAVNVTFDALVDETFSGTVFQIDPQLSQVSGVTVVRALVRLDDYAKPQTLPLGLNATVEVISGQADNVLLVPVEAVREIAPDQYAVFVMVNGEPELTMVEVGLMDFTFAEIRAGLEQGDVVTTGIVETQ